MLKHHLKYALLLFGLVGISSCGNEEAKEQPTAKVPETNNTIETKRISFSLLQQYPHKTTAYTEGLQYVDGYMYESTGQYGSSYLYKYDLKTGKILLEYKLENKYFGEGMTVMGDKIYMLTYREKTGFVFDKNTFKLLRTFTVNTSEGWGLTNDSTYLIFGDGSASLYYLDTTDFHEVKRVMVTNKYGSVGNINELEFINGYIYANQYERDYILKIDQATGYVVGECDLRRVRAQAGIPENRHIEGQAEVMNGIAYDKENNRIFITGKNWDKTLEVKLDN